MSAEANSTHAPQAQGRIDAVDGLRALAIVMVYLYHTWQFAGSPALAVGGGAFSLGTVLNGFPAGVDLFMVLSGFCLFWPLAKRPEGAHGWSAGVFALRRIRRIVPPYYAAILYVTLLPLALVVIYRVLGQPAKWQTPAGLWQYVSHLLFVHTLSPATWSGIQGAFWSLGLEAQFYVVFPIVVLGFRRTGIRVVWYMILLSVVYRIAARYWFGHESWDTQFVASIFFLGRWMQFAAGMLAAWLVARGLPRPWNSAAAGGGLLAAGLAAYVAGQLASESFLPFRDLALAAAFSLGLVGLCGTTFPLRHLFESRLSRGLGLISYSVFLIHQNTAFYLGELLKKVLHLGGPSRFAVLATFGFAGIVALSALFFRFCERPFLNAPARRAVAREEKEGFLLPTATTV